MSNPDVNPTEVNTALDAASGLPGSALNLGRDVFGQPLHKSATALSNPNHPLLSPDNSKRDGESAQIDPLTGLPAHRSTSGGVYGDEFESGIVPIDQAAHLAGQALDALDRVVESSTPVVRKAIAEAATQLAETIHQSLDIAQTNWNAPDNELRKTLSGRINQAAGLFKQTVSNLSANPEVKEVIDTATRLGRTLAQKTGALIETAQSATEAWVDTAFHSSYIDSSLAAQLAQASVHRNSTPFPFIGVIDTSFAAQSHGAQVVDAIKELGQLPDWMDDSVGTGHWAESLVQFVDKARSAGRVGAIANLSFDLTQINPDGSVTTRFEFTSAERNALRYARENGVLIVAAAGNQDGAISALGQASQEFDNVITVGASENGHRAAYSSKGDGLDLVASGDGTGGEGTSLSAARVTAAAAKVWQTNPQFSYRQIAQTLEATATDLEKPGWDRETGFGQLNTPAAVDLAQDAVNHPDLVPSLQLTQRGDRADRIKNPVKSLLNERDNLLNKGLNKGHLTWSYIEGATPSERPSSVESSQGTAASQEESSSARQQSSLPVIVRPGDTLWEIAQRELGAGSRWTELRQADGSHFTEQETRGLQIGTKVYLPDAESQQPSHSNPVGSGSSQPSRETYVVQPGDTLWDIAHAELGDGDRWTELQKSDGSGFTAQEAHKLQIGTLIHLPEEPMETTSAVQTATSSGQPEGRAYRVQSGDTLWEVAQRRLGDGSRWQELQKADGSSFTEQEADQLQVGTLVYLPENKAASSADQVDSQKHTVRSGETLWSIAERELGDGNRWQELRTEDGRPFTEQEASQVQEGTTVYIQTPLSIAGNTEKGVLFGLHERQRYQLEPQRGGTVTGIRDTQAGRVSQKTGKPVGAPLIRFDVPDKTTKYPHINLNPQLTNKPDPHTKISPGTLRAAGGTARALEGLGKVAKPVAVVTDTIRVADAIKADVADGGLPGENTAVTAGSVAGGWGGAAAGAWGGAQLGATIGTFVGGPVGAGVGGFVGGLAGGIAGAFGGSWAGENLVKSFWD